MFFSLSLLTTPFNDVRSFAHVACCFSMDAGSVSILDDDPFSSPSLLRFHGGMYKPVVDIIGGDIAVIYDEYMMNI